MTLSDDLDGVRGAVKCSVARLTHRNRNFCGRIRIRATVSGAPPRAASEIRVASKCQSISIGHGDSNGNRRERKCVHSCRVLGVAVVRAMPVGIQAVLLYRYRDVALPTLCGKWEVSVQCIVETKNEILIHLSEICVNRWTILSILMHTLTNREPRRAGYIKFTNDDASRVTTAIQWLRWLREEYYERNFSPIMQLIGVSRAMHRCEANRFNFRLALAVYRVYIINCAKLDIYVVFHCTYLSDFNMRSVARAILASRINPIDN